MNSGTGWTKRHKQSVAKVVKPTINHASHRLLIWILILVVLPAGVLSAFMIMSAKASADEQIMQGILSRERAEIDDSLLKRRLSQESAYRKYARREATTFIATGTGSFSGAPALSMWGHIDPTKLDSIVNKQHPIYPLDFSPNVIPITCGDGQEAEMVSAAKNDLTALCEAAAVAHAPLFVTSSYRSYVDQLDVYRWWIDYGAVGGADSDSAQPGYSEHQLGLSIDFASPSGAALEAFAGTPQYTWLQENAWKYGFIQRYTTANELITGYNAEVWHYRYVGKAVAADYVKSHAISLEQYWHISGGTYDKAIYTTIPADAK